MAIISTATAQDVALGGRLLLIQQRYSPILEFTLANGARLDVAALGPDGTLLGVEIKVALADLRGDTKWPEYLEFCEHFYFVFFSGRRQHTMLTCDWSSDVCSSDLVATVSGDTARLVGNQNLTSTGEKDRRLVALGFSAAYVAKLTENDKDYQLRVSDDPGSI